MSDEVLIKVENISKKFCRSLKKSLWYGVQDIISEVNPWGNAGRVVSATAVLPLRKDEFWAANDISFELRRGECLGLIGRNGAGKTTLLKMLNGLIKPDHGRIEMRGRVGALIALGAGFNPILSGRENIYVNGSVLGLAKSEIEAKIESIIDFADIRDFIDSPVQSYSSGMQVRLGFAVATALEPDVLILDEVLAVGDAAFRNKCYQRIAALRKSAAIIFVSHNMEQVSRICNYALVLSRGRIHYRGSTSEGISSYETLNDSGEEVSDAFLSVSEPVTEFYADFESAVISSGSKLTIDIRVVTVAVMRKFSVRVVFYNGSGAIAADGTFAPEAAFVEAAAGVSTWKITLATIPLKNGKYRISFNLISFDGSLLAWSHKMQTLTIVGAYAGGIADCQLSLLKWDYSNAGA